MRTVMTRRTVIGLVGASALALTTAAPAISADDAKPDRLAIKGYDPVAYFTEGRPRIGSSEFEYVWEDTRWHFASATNRDLFRGNPDRYAPQYAGYCAFGIAKGMKAEVDPNAWTIVDGKLYLNYNTKAREEWRQDRVAYIKEADDNWPALRK